jgi:unspecific monooxygenase
VQNTSNAAFLKKHDSVSATLSWWRKSLSANPQAQEIARSEVALTLKGAAPDKNNICQLGYLKQTLEETLRLYPSAPFLHSGRATRPITLGNWQFPARTMFVIPVALLHRDPRWFANPTAFMPERFRTDAQAIPRGAYIPFCAGEPAQTELLCVAATLLQRSRVLE